ncbi:MAG TPA: hypothetical protein VHG90_06800 [Acidimicrobiales bacterium]|nr:hypothetical protein [Acidimicrobiales bacterium]
MTPQPADERRHPAEADAGWEESWYFDFVTADGRLGAFVRLALRPGEGRAWYWAYLAGRGRPVVAVRDHEVEPPRGRALEVRSAGLWAELTCETPLDHWSTGLEAFGVALDDPTDAWRGERGDRVALGLDMEWEAGERRAVAVPDGYAQPATVHGEVLVGRERIEVDGRGWRTHLWGVPGPRLGSWWTGAHLGDGTAVLAWSSGDAWVCPPAGEPVSSTARGGPDSRPDGLVRGAGVGVGDLELTLEPVGQAVVPFEGSTAGDGLVRAMCSLSGAGRSGWGWYEVGAGRPRD